MRYSPHFSCALWISGVVLVVFYLIVFILLQFAFRADSLRFMGCKWRRFTGYVDKSPGFEAFESKRDRFAPTPSFRDQGLVGEDQGLSLPVPARREAKEHQKDSQFRILEFRHQAVQ